MISLSESLYNKLLHWSSLDVIRARVNFSVLAYSRYRLTCPTRLREKDADLQSWLTSAVTSIVVKHGCFRTELRIVGNSNKLIQFHR